MVLGRCGFGPHTRGVRISLDGKRQSEPRLPGAAFPDRFSSPWWGLLRYPHMVDGCSCRGLGQFQALDGGIASFSPLGAHMDLGVSVGAAYFLRQDFNLHWHGAARFAKLENLLSLSGILQGGEQLEGLHLYIPVLSIGLRENPPCLAASYRAVILIACHAARTPSQKCSIILE